MGLDMYLTAERYFWHNEGKPQIDGIPEGYEPRTVTVEAAYWRKANGIHKWFVDNVQEGIDECQAHYVPREKLIELRDLCQQVIDKPERAVELLPTQSGFFFGGTEYDEWYFRDLEDTVELLDKALTSFSENDWDFEYRSSW